MLCVLVAIALAAAFSPYSAVASFGRQPILDKPHLGSFGRRLNVNKIALISGNLNVTSRSVAYDLSDALVDGDDFRRQSKTVQSIPAGRSGVDTDAAASSEADRDRLFQEFLNWQARESQ